MLDGIFVSAECEFNLDSLLETFEAPVALRLFQGWNTEEFLHSFFRAIGLQLLRVVVLVLDINIASLRFIIVFVLKVIPLILSVRVDTGLRIGTHSASESCMKSSSSDMLAVIQID